MNRRIIRDLYYLTRQLMFDELDDNSPARARRLLLLLGDEGAVGQRVATALDIIATGNPNKLADVRWAALEALEMGKTEANHDTRPTDL
jgi:hypothetical protein